MRRLKPSFITALLAVGLCGHGCDRVKELKDSRLGLFTALKVDVKGDGGVVGSIEGPLT